MEKDEVKKEILELKNYLKDQIDQILNSDYASDLKKKEWLYLLKAEMEIRIDRLKGKVTEKK